MEKEKLAGDIVETIQIQAEIITTLLDYAQMVGSGGVELTKKLSAPIARLEALKDKFK